jgi:N-acyl-D-aspartate/D-glutamate deacylase
MPLLVLNAFTASMMDRLDLIIRNGLVCVGEEGVAPQVADVGILEGKIQYVGFDNQAESINEIDATGHVVMPGFVDVHSHTDESALRPNVDSKLLQGVTTEICGQCGGAPAPLSSSKSIAKRRRVKMDEDGWYPGDVWTSFASYFSLLRSKGCAVNQVVFAGWWTLCDDHAMICWKHSFRDVLSALERGLADGAGGLSIHQESDTWKQLSRAQTTQMARILSKTDKPVAIHLADYSEQLIRLTTEIISIFARQDVKLQISHMKILGHDRSGTLKRFKELVGSDHISPLVRFDVVPFPSICTRLHFIVARSAQFDSSGPRGACDRRSRFNYLDNFKSIRGLGRGWTMERTDSREWSPEERSALRGLSCGEGQDELVEAEGLDASNISSLLASSQSFVGSDASSFVVDTSNRSGHPLRVFDTFPSGIRYLLGFGLDLSGVSAKLSAKPCQWFKIDQRGKLRPGWWADMVIARFDREPNGCDVTVRDVIVNGKIAVRNGLTVSTTHGVPLAT